MVHFIVLVIHMRRTNCIFIAFDNGFCIANDMKTLSLKKYLYLNVMFANKIQKKKDTVIYTD